MAATRTPRLARLALGRTNAGGDAAKGTRRGDGGGAGGLRGAAQGSPRGGSPQFTVRLRAIATALAGTAAARRRRLTVRRSQPSPPLPFASLASLAPQHRPPAGLSEGPAPPVPACSPAEGALRASSLSAQPLPSWKGRLFVPRPPTSLAAPWREASQVTPQADPLPTPSQDLSGGEGPCRPLASMTQAPLCWNSRCRPPARLQPTTPKASLLVSESRALTLGMAMLGLAAAARSVPRASLKPMWPRSSHWASHLGGGVQQHSKQSTCCCKWSLYGL